MRTCNGVLKISGFQVLNCMILEPQPRLRPLLLLLLVLLELLLLLLLSRLDTIRRGIPHDTIGAEEGTVLQEK